MCYVLVLTDDKTHRFFDLDRCDCLCQHWTDIYLTWNPENYPGVQNLRFPSDQVWTPDILLYNRSELLPLSWNLWLGPVGYQLFCFGDLSKSSSSCTSLLRRKTDWVACELPQLQCRDLEKGTNLIQFRNNADMSVFQKAPGQNRYESINPNLKALFFDLPGLTR